MNQFHFEIEGAKALRISTLTKAYFLYIMTQQEIKKLEPELWDAADELRGNSKLTAGEYKDPLLGLVLLRFAQNRYEDAKVEIAKSLTINPRTGQTREVTQDDKTENEFLFLEFKKKCLWF